MSTSNLELGSFVEGEVPEPLEYQFQDSTGAPIDLTGYSATFSLRIGTTETTLPATVTEPDEGVVTHVWLEDELVRSAGGSLRCEFIATNGTNTFVSERLRGFVRTPIYVEVGP